MKRLSFLLGVLVVVLSGVFTKPIRGANAVYIPGFVIGDYSGGSIEIQGSSSPINLPVSFQGTSPADPFVDVFGATANDSTAYTLLTDATPSSNSLLLLSDPHSGALLSTVQLDTQLSDIAYTNGQLYGIANKSNALQIFTIGANGTTQSVLNQSMTSSTATWRLSGVANGSGLLAARGSFPSTDMPGFVVNPSTFSVSTITLAGTKNTQLNDNVINAAGNAAVSVGTSAQTITAFPGGGSLGTVASGAQYGTSFIDNRVSDEFNYTYSPSLPAVAQTQWNATVSPLLGVQDGLTRTAQVVSVSGPLAIKNFVAPDNTTLSNVAATNQISQFFGPQFGTTPFTVSVQNSPAGDFSNRVIGQGAATLDLATAERGLYSISSSSSITADYTYGLTVDHGRTVQSTGGSGTSFAYEPVSSNLVGNGDAAMNGAGWQGTLAGTFRSQVVNSDPSNHRFDLVPFSTQPAAMRQFLQLPTPNSPMQFSFTYSLQSLPAHSDDIQVFLNSVLLADIQPTSTTTQTFQMTIDNPALENLTNPLLLFQATSTTSLGDTVYIGNIVLTAVPEPTIGWIVPFASTLLFVRRWRRGIPA